MSSDAAFWARPPDPFLTALTLCLPLLLFSILGREHRCGLRGEGGGRGEKSVEERGRLPAPSAAAWGKAVDAADNFLGTNSARGASQAHG